MAIIGEFYDSDKQLIATSEALVWRQNEWANMWRAMDRALFFTPPAGATYFRAAYQVAAPGTVSAPTTSPTSWFSKGS